MSRNLIVVATDFSDAARSAFELAWPLCARLNAKLMLVHAWRPTGWLMAIDETPSWLDAARDAAEARLAGWADDARQRGIEVDARLVDGAASSVLIELARELDPRLVVVGRRGNAGLAHVLLGSVSERVVRHASSPVLVVPVGARAAVPERLLVGVDFSNAAREATDLAATMAKDLNSSRGILLTHARPNRDDLRPADGADYDDLNRWPFGRELLEEWARPLSDGGEVDTLLVEGAPEIALSLAARTTGCDWIVVGVHGRTALSSLMMGSSTSRLLELTDRPVLTAPVGAAPAETPD